MLQRLKNYIYGIRLNMKGARLKHPIRANNFLFGNVRGLSNGKNIMLDSFVKLNISGENASLSIGDFVYINSYTVIDCHYKISIGTRVQIGPNCYIGDFDHDIHVDIRRPLHRGEKIFAAVVIEDNVWLGAGVIVLKGVTIGRNSVIAAGSVVVKDIAANVLAAGSPAKPIKSIENNFDDESYYDKVN